MELADKLMEILKQPLYNPIPHHEQVVILYAASHGYFKGIPTKEVRDYCKELISHIKTYHSEILEEIDTKAVLDDELTEKLDLAVRDFTE